MSSPTDDPVATQNGGVIRRRPGMTHVYTLRPGDDWRMMRDGTLIILNPEREPLLIHTDGTREVLRPWWH